MNLGKRFLLPFYFFNDYLASCSHMNSDSHSRLQGHWWTLSYCFHQNTDHRQNQIQAGENMQLQNKGAKPKLFVPDWKQKENQHLRTKKPTHCWCSVQHPQRWKLGLFLIGAQTLKIVQKYSEKYGCSTKACAMRDSLLLILTWKTFSMTGPLSSGVAVLSRYSDYQW